MQRTAYDMRISDWSSDVCSSDLDEAHQHLGFHARLDDALHQVVVSRVAILMGRLVAEVMGLVDHDEIVVAPIHMPEVDIARQTAEIGRASCRERVCQYA